MNLGFQCPRARREQGQLALILEQKRMKRWKTERAWLEIHRHDITDKLVQLKFKFISVFIIFVRAEDEASSERREKNGASASSPSIQTRPNAYLLPKIEVSSNEVIREGVLTSMLGRFVQYGSRLQSDLLQ